MRPTPKSLFGIKAVLFDLDDTLYPECAYVESGFRAVSEHLAARFRLDADVACASLLQILKEEGRGQVFNRFLRSHGIADESVVPDLVSIYRSHRPGISLFPGVVSCLESLKQRRIRLGVVTDGLLVMQQNKVDALGLAQLVDSVVFTDSFGKPYWKPHKLPFQAALDALSMQPRETVFIGNDPAKDFPAPLALGMAAIHVCSHESLSRSCCPAHLHVTSIVDAVRSLSALNS